MLHQINLLFRRFLTDARQLFRFFVIVNLIPCILLVFTEPYSFMGKVILVTFPLGMYLFVFSWLKNIGLMQLILIPQLIFNAFQIVLFYLFGESVIAVDMFLNLATTNVTEASELLNNLWPAIILVCVIYIPTIVIAAIGCKKRVHLTPVFRKKMACTGLIIGLVSYGLTFTATNRNTGSYKLQYDVFPVNIYYNLRFAVKKWQRSMIYPLTSKDFTFQAHKSVKSADREIYVLVVGEASRAVNWSLWGYERETNPLLSQIQGLALYKDAITQANATHKSVPLILSAANAEHFEDIYGQKSIVEAFKKQGSKRFSSRIRRLTVLLPTILQQKRISTTISARHRQEGSIPSITTTMPCFRWCSIISIHYRITYFLCCTPMVHISTILNVIRGSSPILPRTKRQKWR